MSRLQHHSDNAPAHGTTNTKMQGFDAEFTNIVDYILRITLRIWEGKQVGLCRDYYSDDCPVYTSAGMSAGAEEVTQNTINTLGAFPDRTLDAVNIIWDGDDSIGYHTSHLIDTEMTNLGDSEFGEASNKRGKILVIAHCIVKDNKIIEEWLVRDNYLLAQQLGFDPQEIAEQFAQTPLQERFSNWIEAEKSRVDAQVSRERRSLPKNNVARSVTAQLHNIWNCQMIGDVRQLYAADAIIHASGSRELNGFDDIADFYISFQSTFSNLKVTFDYICKQSNANLANNDPDNADGEKQEIAVRWTMTGTHSGRRLFGAPSGAKVLLLGESHYTLLNGKIIEEWTVFDQLAVMTQICRARHSLTA